MLGVAGILAQEIVKPGVFFYSAGLPENLPNINFGGPDGKVCTCWQIEVQWQERLLLQQRFAMAARSLHAC